MEKQKVKKAVDRRLRVFTDAEREKIKDMYLNDMVSATEIREIYGCGVNVMRKFLKEEGIMRTSEELYAVRSESKMRQYTEEERQDIVNQYNTNGGKVAPIKRAYGCCATPIIRVLLEEGIDARGMKPNSPCLEKLYAKFEETDNK